MCNTKLLEAALEYHKRGYFVFAIGGRSDDPTGKKPSKRVGTWRNRTSTTKDIEYWFADPLVTGIGLRLDNLVALDIDTYKGDVEGDFCKDAGCVSSGRGKTSIWKLPGDLVVKTNDKLSNCEIKTGSGAYILIPPSWHVAKKAPYEWLVGDGPWDAVELTPPLIRLITKGGGSPDATSRHAQLIQCAMVLRKEGKNEEEILLGLEAYNVSLAEPKDEDDNELAEIATWAYKNVSNITISHLTLRKEFVRMYKGVLLYVTDTGHGCWRAWNGHYWEEYGVGQFKGLILRCVDHMRELARTDQYKPHWANSLAQWAPGETALHTKALVFDKLKDHLNCKNVTWTPHGTHEPRQEDYITRYVNVNYIPDRLVNLENSKWGKFLRDTCTSGGVVDSQLLDYLQLTVGYSVYGSNELQVVFFVYGPPNTGKSTFLEAIRSVLGDYAHTMASNAILKSKFQQQNTPDVAALEGKRLVVSSEIKKDIALDEELFKCLTGNEQISATAKYKAPKEIVVEAKFWIAGNDLPSFDYEDDAVKKRIKVVPFINTVPPSGVDLTLRDTFYTDEFEREIILAWMLEGAQKYSELQQLEEPECVQRATQTYFEKQDDLGSALLECTNKCTSTYVVLSELFEAITFYLRLNSLPPVSATKLGKKLKARGYRKGTEQVKGKQVRVWYGLQLKEDYKVIV